MNNFWNQKEDFAEQAKKHTENMKLLFSSEIENSIKNTIEYNNEVMSTENKTKFDTAFYLEDMDSVSAIFEFKNKDEKIAVLNFASYKNPGGGFLNGSKAQEECLCQESFLYNVLESFEDDFYYWNRDHLNKSLYLNRALYSPDVIFFQEENSVSCDVITCAAPNKHAAQKYSKVSDKENSDVLKLRIKFILDIAKENQVDTLILGAYGCGVFGQLPMEVAFIFKDYFRTDYEGCFKKVVFAIPDGKNNNYVTFRKVFGYL